MKLKPLPRHELSFLHLGDSYTIGEGVPVPQSWPGQLQHMLEIKGWRFRDTQIVARTGWTTADLLSALDTEALSPGWDVVTLCIGVNNQYQNRDLQEFRRELTRLLKRAKAHASPNDGQVILLSIPDWSVSPFGAERDRSAIREAIDQFNDICYRMATTLDVAFIEWTSLTRLFVDEEKAFAEDGLHPSAIQYTEWATFLLQYLIPGS